LRQGKQLYKRLLDAMDFLYKAHLLNFIGITNLPSSLYTARVANQARLNETKTTEQKQMKA
jgi:hypothetical protein